MPVLMRRSRLLAIGAAASAALAGAAALWVHGRGRRMARALRRAPGEFPVQTMKDGFGPIFFRTYRLDIPLASLDAEALMASIQQDPARFSPAGIAKFEKTHGAPGALAEGDEFYIHISGPWDGPVRVSRCSSTSFHLVTLRDHMEAGTIRFRTIDLGDHGLRFEIASCARSTDSIVHTLYDTLHIARGAQQLMWTTFCERVGEDACAPAADRETEGDGQDAGQISDGEAATVSLPDVEVRTFSARYDDPLTPQAATDPTAYQSLLGDLAKRALNFEPQHDADRREGWHYDTDEVELISEPDGPPLASGSWSHACDLVRAYRFPDPRLVVGHFNASAPLDGRTMLLQARFLGLQFPFGVRVSHTVDETQQTDDGPVRVWGYGYHTLEEHFERGQIEFVVGKALRSGRVFFRIQSYSAPAPIKNPLYRLGFRLFGRRLQRQFVLEALERTRAYVEERLVRDACLEANNAATRLLLGDPFPGPAATAASHET